MTNKGLKRLIAFIAAFCISFSGLPLISGHSEADVASNISNFKAKATGQTTVSLSWAKLSKSQQKKVSGIAVFRNGKLIKRLSKKTYSFKSSRLRAGTTYSYQIKAYKKIKVKKWYNKKTKKWQTKKPKKKNRGKTRKVTKYSYIKKSRIVKVTTKAAPAPAKPTTDEEKSFTLELGSPVVVAQKEGNKESLGWGVFQFPMLYYSGNQMICKIADKTDSVSSYEGGYLYYASTDKGKKWEAIDQGTDCPDNSILMENGRYLQGAVYKNAFESRLSEKYDPQYVSDDGTLALYYADSISDDDYSKSFECVEYDPASKESKRFTSVFEWPYMPVREVSGLTYSAATCMYHFRMHSTGMIVKEANGDLLMAAYSQGFNTENGTVNYGKHYNIYIFRSTDCARTWKYVSQILTEPDYCPENGDGFCEPNIIITPSGDYFVLMRTGTNMPSYCAYSSDKGRTWDGVAPFSSVGVDPQLLQLDCGVCLASYGRPGIYIRATNDKQCKNWSDEIAILEPDKESNNYWKDSCGYSSLIQTGKDTALIAYSVFDYPEGEDADVITKTIIVREIKVVYR